jgi:hypothetical protein
VTATPAVGDRALVLSISAVWKRHFDQQSTMFASASRPWELSPGPSRMWGPYREAAALGMAMWLTDVAGASFARLYASSLVDSEALSWA